MAMKKLVSICALLAFTSPLYAIFTFNTTCTQAYSDIICLRFDKANSLLLYEKKQNPDNQIPFMLDHYIGFIKVMIGEEEKDFNLLKKNESSRLQKLAKSNSESPWFRHSQAIIYFQTGFARVKFGEYLNAGLDINTSYRLLEENLKKFPAFAPSKTLLGFLHALLGTVPAKYKWAIRTLNFEGSIAQGLEEMNESFASEVSDPSLEFLLPETAYLLSYITLNLTSNPGEVPALNLKLNTPSLQAMRRESPLLLYLQADMYKHSGMNDEIISLLSGYSQNSSSYPYPYLNYLLGVAKMNRLDKDADYPFIEFVGNFKGKNYIKSAYLYLSWYYALHGNENQYNTYINRIKIRGNSQVDNDREALSMATKNKKPDMNLLKARLLCDGGYYDEAEKVLLNFKSFNQETELEYVYRLGRIYDKWGKTDKALLNYNKAITLGEKMPYHFAANAALQAGIMNEKAKNYSLARKYFEKVLTLDFDEYQFSIKNKAEAGLNRLKDN